MQALAMDSLAHYKTSALSFLVKTGHLQKCKT
jgi:hypothetical protein